MDWKQLPPSKKQIEVLKRNCIAIPKTRGEASQHISEIQSFHPRGARRRARRKYFSSSLGGFFAQAGWGQR